MADPTRDSLLREIDEDLRHERYALLWQRYGSLVIAAAVILVLAVAGYQGWKSYQQSRRVDAGERFTGAIALAETDPESAAVAFRGIAEDAPAGYEILARLRQAAAYVREGNPDAAAAAYDELESATDDPLYLDMATVLQTMAMMEKPVPAEEVARLQARLSPLMAPDRPYRYTAREISALLALQAGDAGKARTILTEVSTDVQAPQGVRSRAESLLDSIGNGGGS